MSDSRIIDTFPEFFTLWKKFRRASLDQQINAWKMEYMSHWPELLAKQLENYSADNVDWWQIARERIFPFLDERLFAMQRAHENLPRLCMEFYSKAKKVLSFDTDMIFVIYVGIGCGAGWATSYNNVPAVLFGLENIAECGWSKIEPLTGLIAHEIGHLVHKHWRTQGRKIDRSGSWWRLYEEGFAAQCEHLILEKESWHESIGINDEEWLDWCQNNRNWLATQFLAMHEEELIRSFFGSWYDICGHKQCGHFLGHELIKELKTNMGLEEIALLDNVEQQLRPLLEEMAD